MANSALARLATLQGRDHARQLQGSARRAQGKGPGVQGFWRSCRLCLGRMAPERRAEIRIRASGARLVDAPGAPRARTRSTNVANTSCFTPLAQMLISANNGLVLHLLPTWAPDTAVRKKILVDNPARLCRILTTASVFIIKPRASH